MSEVMNALREGFKDVQQKVDEKFNALQSEVDILAQRQDPVLYGKAANPFASKVLENAQVKALASRETRSAIIPLSGMGIKTIVGIGGDSADDPVNVQAQRFTGGIGGYGMRRKRLLMELPSFAVDSGSFEIHRFGTGTDFTAGVQAEEGDVKTQTDPVIDTVTSYISTIAHFYKASNQVLADANYLRLILDQHMREGLADKIEADLINGAGGTGNISGLATEATAFGPATTNTWRADRVSEACANLEANGWTCTHVLMHPNDWHEIRVERSSDGLYVGSGRTTLEAESLWGIPVITSASMTQGTAIAFDASQVMLLDRQQPIVEMGYVNDDFTRNCVTVRAEARVGLAVMSPGAVLQFDLQTS